MTEFYQGYPQYILPVETPSGHFAGHISAGDFAKALGKILGYLRNKLEEIAFDHSALTEIIDWAEKFFPRKTGRLVNSKRVRFMIGVVNKPLAHSPEYYYTLGHYLNIHTRVLTAWRLSEIKLLGASNNFLIPIFSVLLEVTAPYAWYVNLMRGVNWTNPKTEEAYLDKWLWYTTTIIRNYLQFKIANIPPLYIPIRLLKRVHSTILDRNLTYYEQVPVAPVKEINIFGRYYGSKELPITLKVEYYPTSWGMNIEEINVPVKTYTGAYY